MNFSSALTVFFCVQVLIPSEQKVSSEKEDKSCYTAFEEDCN